MNQLNSIFMPGLTRRGPVYNSTFGSITRPGPRITRGNSNYLNGLGAYLSGLPALPSMAKYALMAGLLYLGYDKKLPLGIAGGAAAAFAVWQFFPEASTAAQGSGAPTVSDITATTAGAGMITPDISSVLALPTPTLSGLYAQRRNGLKFRV
jgi:hypothetical protein